MTHPTWIVSLKDAVAASGQELMAYLPNVLGAAVLLLVGWLVARLLRALTTRSLSRIGAFVGGKRIEHEMQAAGVDHLARQATGAIVFWLVLLRLKRAEVCLRRGNRHCGR